MASIKHPNNLKTYSVAIIGHKDIDTTLPRPKIDLISLSKELSETARYFSEA